MSRSVLSAPLRSGLPLAALVIAIALLSSPALAASGWVAERPSSDTVLRANPASLSTYTDNMEGPHAWTLYSGGASSYLSGASGGYVTAAYSSPSTSLKAAFSGGLPDGTDYGYTTDYQDFAPLFKAQTIQVKYEVTAYSHDYNIYWDSMDAGIKLRLFDSLGVNYATYQYWFAAWYHNTDTKTPGSNTKLIGTGKPTLNTWYSFSSDPNVDWSIDWTKAASVRVQLYVSAAGTYGDSFTIYFDDFSMDLLQAVGVQNGYATANDVYPNMAVTVGVGVEVYQFYKNYGGTGKDRYVLRVSGDATSRIAHKYFPAYKSLSNAWWPGYYDLGLTQDNTGKWYDFGDVMDTYLYGKAYRRIFVCSNGWASFSYTINGQPAPDYSSCPATPQHLPTPDYRDGNGVRVDTPDGVLAPLWRPLTFSGGGRVHYLSVSAGGSTHVSISWDGMANVNDGLKNFVSIRINPDGGIFYGYYTATDYSDANTKIGIEDPSGQLGLEVSLSSIMSNGGGLFLSDNHPFDEQISDTKIVVQKGASTDQSTLGFEETNLAGYNIRTSNPPPADGGLGPAGTAAGVLGSTGACVAATLLFDLVTFGTATAVCFAIDVGIAFAPDIVNALSKPPPDPSVYKRDDMLSSEVSGSYEVPVRDENFLCGFNGGGAGQVDCAVDTSVFDILDWDLPVDTQSHTLQIWFGVRMGDISGPRDLWYYTGVSLNVGPDNSIFTDQLSRNDFTVSAPDANRASWFYWTMDGLWHETSRRYTTAGQGYKYFSAWYGQESTLNYDTGARNFGSLTGPLTHILLTGNSFVFSSWYDTESGTTYDKKLVQVSLNRGLSWTTILQIPDSTDQPKVWIQHVVSLNAYVGKDILIRFFFDTVDAVLNGYEGWYIDDVTIGSSGGGGGCVAFDTPVLTDRGYTPVQDLKKGDVVIGYDLTGGARIPLALLSAKMSWSENLIVINGGALVVTAVDQPIYAKVGPWTGWVLDPQNLKSGDQIFDATHGQWIEVTSIQLLHERTRVYDVQTSGVNDFIANGFLLDAKKK